MGEGRKKGEDGRTRGRERGREGKTELEKAKVDWKARIPKMLTMEDFDIEGLNIYYRRCRIYYNALR